MNYNTEKCVFNYHNVYTYIYSHQNIYPISWIIKGNSVPLSQGNVYHLKQQIYILYYSLHINMNYDD